MGYCGGCGELAWWIYGIGGGKFLASPNYFCLIRRYLDNLERDRFGFIFRGFLRGIFVLFSAVLYFRRYILGRRGLRFLG